MNRQKGCERQQLVKWATDCRCRQLREASKHVPTSVVIRSKPGCSDHGTPEQKVRHGGGGGGGGV